MSDKTESTKPRVALHLDASQMRDVAKLLRWFVQHGAVLAERAELAEPDEALRAQKLRIVEAYFAAYVQAVVAELGGTDHMRRLFIDPPDAEHVDPDALRPLARAMLAELDAKDDAERQAMQ